MRNDYPGLARVGGPRTKAERRQFRVRLMCRVLGFILPALVFADAYECQIRTIPTLVHDSRCGYSGFTLQQDLSDGDDHCANFNATYVDTPLNSDGRLAREDRR